MIIILQHGLFGFAARQVGPVSVEYFAGIPDALKRAGHTPITTGVNPIGGVAERAAQLRRQILEKVPTSRSGEKMLLIGHSMGGLDIREMLARSGADLVSRVAAVVSIATPHHGSPVADLIMSVLDAMHLPAMARRLTEMQRTAENLFLGEGCKGRTFLPDWMGRMHINWDAIPNLTSRFCREFNQNTANAPGVRHFWIAASCAQKTPFFLTRSFELVLNAEPPAGGENDGVVSVASATPPDDPANPWRSLGIWPVDHVHAVNMRLPTDRNRPDVSGWYVDLLSQLNEAGVPTPRDPA